jgi:thiol-disulfide isomerase/thioredoxin
VTAAGKRATIRTAGAAVLLMIAGRSLVRSSPANTSNVVGTTIFPSGQRPLMPAVPGRTLTGQELPLAADHGHVIVLNFRGSWCTVCLQEAPALTVAAQQLKPSGVQFVGVDVADNTTSAKAYMQHYGIAYPSLNDPGELIAAEFNQLIPLSALPARSGRRRSWRTGNAPVGMSPCSVSSRWRSVENMSENYLPAVVGVAVVGDRVLRLLFSDGTAGDVDFSAERWTGVLAPLNDPAYFAQVAVDAEAGTIVWPDGIDLAPEPLYEQAKAHPLLAA